MDEQVRTLTVELGDADRYFVVCPVRLAVVVATIALSACVSSTTGTGEGPERARTQPAAADVDLRTEAQILSARVMPGMTLESLLRAGKIAEEEAAHVISAVKAVFEVRKVRTGRPYHLTTTVDGALREFRYEIDDDQFVRVGRSASDAAWVADVQPIPKTHTSVVLQGTIDRASPSLFSAVAAAGGTVELAIALAEIFGGEVDFNTGLQPADRFTLVVDKQFRETQEFSGFGPIAVAEFHNEGRRMLAVRYTQAGSPPGYFDEQGVSMRRFMLRSPLKFDPVVTSRFSRRRLHPVLGGYRAHLGVDYRAPAGAPVVAVAGGAVVRAGANGGAGRMVHLRHANGFETEYLHLSSITVRAGTRVQQGDIIGRVGSTGLATGPHLDYRVRKNGVFINPLTVFQHLPPAEPVAQSEMAAFAMARDRALAALRTPPVLRASAEDRTP